MASISDVALVPGRDNWVVDRTAFSFKWQERHGEEREALGSGQLGSKPDSAIQ